MNSEIVFITGKELKDLVNQSPDHTIYFNGYKYYFTPSDLEKLNDSTVYMMFQKYGKLFVKPRTNKSVIVKSGTSLRSKKAY